MAELINLRLARKQAKRRDDDEHARANRLAYGQPKAARALKAAQDAKTNRDLDGHRLDNGDGQ